MPETIRFVVTLLLTTGLLGAQAAVPSITVTGDVPAPLTLTAAGLAKMPRETVRASNEGVEIRYEGVWLHEVLRTAGAPAGTALRGKAMTTYVLVEAADGYQVLFSLAEIDPLFGNLQVLLADSADGKPLFGMQGPFRLVVSKEQRGARAVRMVSKIQVIQVRK